MPETGAGPCGGVAWQEGFGRGMCQESRNRDRVKCVRANPVMVCIRREESGVCELWQEESGRGVSPVRENLVRNAVGLRARRFILNLRNDFLCLRIFVRQRS